MTQAACPDVIVYVCANCLPEAGALPRQWKQDDAHVVVHEMPCTGKVDVQYLLHALEGGVRGVCVVGCPKGQCHLAQGNYRVEVRIHTVQRLLSEIGLEPERAVLLHCSSKDPVREVQQKVRQAASRLCGLGTSPVRAAA